MINDVQEHYRRLVRKHGDSHLSAQYSSEETQERRFHHLLRAGDITQKKVLDFGCGAAAFAGFLERKGINCSYVGYDFVEEFYPIAQKKFPRARFLSKPQFDSEEYDYIFISGVFNNLTENNTNFYKKTLENLFKKANICIAFNMLSAYVDYRDEDLFYVYPEEVFQFCKNNITPYVTIINDYQIKENTIPFEFSCFLYKK